LSFTGGPHSVRDKATSLMAMRLVYPVAKRRPEHVAAHRS
jgi:hypothetical protein